MRKSYLLTGQQIWQIQGASLILPFALLVMLVVSLHELGHAFTLKYYGGIVPDIGLRFMCLMPGCYTNTSDSYERVKRRQRALVIEGSSVRLYEKLQREFVKLVPVGKFF